MAARVVNARQIVSALVRRDLIGRYRRTALGLVWSLIPAVFTVVSFYFLFVVIAGKSPAPDITRPDGTGVPAYVFMSTGVVAWTLFSTAIGSSTERPTGTSRRRTSSSSIVALTRIARVMTAHRGMPPTDHL